MATLATIIARLDAEGFTAHFGVVGNRLRAIGYAIESRNGVRGSLVDAFGVYADPRVSAFLHHVPIRRAVQSGAAEHGARDDISRRRRELETMMVDEWKARADRPVTVPLLHVRLVEQLERFKQEPTWRTSGRDAITLTKEPALRLVLMLLSKGTKLSEHKAAGSLVLHVLSGSVIFRTGSRTETVGAGELIVLEAAIEHEMEAVEDSACLLTLTGRFQPGERPIA